MKKARSCRENIQVRLSWSLWHCAAGIQPSIGMGCSVVDGMTMVLCVTSVMARVGTERRDWIKDRTMHCKKLFNKPES